ncbi:PF20097 family protein [Fusibacter sp. JL216-2]|uniref:PF20097 family protein n=1 Tax=Fusibacter sp. JL216-2 TaxID=3071453 RepID=UPI003D32EA07
MECLECGKTMEKGYIQSAKMTYWTEKKHKLIYESYKKSDVKLTRYDFRGSSAEAYYCSACAYVKVMVPGTEK